MGIMMAGLDIREKLVIVVGGGDVSARRVSRFRDEGAIVRIIAPELSDATAAVVAASCGEDPGEKCLGDGNTTGDTSRDASNNGRASGTVTWVPRPYREGDLDGAWLVHTATGDPEVDRAVDSACQERRIWCIDAASAPRGTARLAAEARQGTLRVGAVSAESPDPLRSARVRHSIQDLLDHDLLPTRPVRRPTHGRVTLIGGGPGPWDLLTLRGHRLLQEADVIIHDRLGPTDALTGLDDGVEVIDVGKSPGNHPVPQPEINALLLDRAQRGLRVARLKGGDPFVFGRGGEEVRACVDAGVPVEVVPGISSAIAAPESADIPVTHRGTADSVHVVNGHREFGPATLAALRDTRTTVVVLMGIAMLPRLVAMALSAGAAAGQPVAIVERAYRSNERTVRATLGTVTQVSREQEVGNPAVVIIGESARPGLLTGAFSTMEGMGDMESAEGTADAEDAEKAAATEHMEDTEGVAV